MHRTVGHHHGLIIRVRSTGRKDARRSRVQGKNVDVSDKKFEHSG